MFNVLTFLGDTAPTVQAIQLPNVAELANQFLAIVGPAIPWLAGAGMIWAGIHFVVKRVSRAGR